MRCFAIRIVGKIMGRRSCLSSKNHARQRSNPPLSALGLRQRQVYAHPWRRDPARWDEPQTGVGQAGLVLVVSAICAAGYRAGKARDGSKRSAKRLVGRSAVGTAVGMAVADAQYALRVSPTGQTKGADRGRERIWL